MSAGRDNILVAGDYVAVHEEHPRTFTIPAPPRDFTGREKEMNALVQALTAGGRAAIIGLTGMGGVGKSALASVIAHRVVKDFPDAEMWVDLHGMDDTPTAPVDAMRQVILAFKPSEDLGKASDDEIAQIYRAVLHGKRTLIVLDNADDTAQVRPLLTAEGAFIVTSRRYFVEQGLQPVRLDVLNEADARTLLLTLSARIGDKADEISELCGRLPLALQIAGRFLARHDDLTPEWYVEQLKQTRLTMLKESNELDVEATFALTYDRLGAETQKRWRMLAVFPAPFGANAAAYVWGTEEESARLSLSNLRNASLAEYDAGKYRLHDILSEFARARTTVEERSRAKKRHAEFYLQVALTADELYWQGGENVLKGLALFDDELPHIRAGQEWAADNVEKDDDAARICTYYPDFAKHCLDLRLHLRDQVQWREIALLSALKLQDKRYESYHLGNLGILFSELGDENKARENLEQARGIAHAIDDTRNEGVWLNGLGDVYGKLGDIPKAIEYCELALSIAREVVNRRDESSCLCSLGNFYCDLDEVPRAIEYYEIALTIAREVGDKRDEGYIIGRLGTAYQSLGDLQKAIEHYERALTIAREIGDQWNEGSWLSNIGIAYADLGDATKAIEHHQLALANDREVGDRYGEADSLGNLGVAYEKVNDTRKAIEYYEQALAIAREIGDRRVEGNLLANMGLAHNKLGDKSRAHTLWQQALAIYEAIGDPYAKAVSEWLNALNGNDAKQMENSKGMNNG